MKLGLVSAILADYSFEEMINVVSKNKLNCVEVACWPLGESERKYAGVTHIDVTTLNNEKINYIKNYLSEKKVEISSLAYYPNVLDEDDNRGRESVIHLRKVIKAASDLGVNMVSTFIGRDPRKNVNENLAKVKEIWPEIIQYAEKCNVKIAIENCPMWFTEDEWPGGKNLMTSISNWRKIFEILDSPNIGIAYDPSHFIWQQIDYIKPIYEFKEKIFLIHFKDIKIYKDKLAEVGIMANPLEYMTPKLPGYGDVDWGKFVSALTDIKYVGYTSIEVEDSSFEDTNMEIEYSISQSTNYLRNFI